MALGREECSGGRDKAQAGEGGVVCGAGVL